MVDRYGHEVEDLSDYKDSVIKAYESEYGKKPGLVKCEINFPRVDLELDVAIFQLLHGSMGVKSAKDLRTMQNALDHVMTARRMLIESIDKV